MRTKVTKKWLARQNPCVDGFEYWVEQKKPDLFDFIRQCIADGNYIYACWLMPRCMDRKHILRYAIYIAKHELVAYQKMYNGRRNIISNVVRDIRLCLSNDSEENRQAASDTAKCVRNYYGTFTSNDAAAFAADAAYFPFGNASSASAYYASCYVSYQDGSGSRDAMFTKLLKYGMRIMKEKQK